MLVACLTVLGPAHADETDACIAESEVGQRLLLARRFVESRPHLIACGRAACPAPVTRDCAERLRQAEASMATVLLVAKRADGSDVQGASVYADGAPSPAPLDGAAIDMDPGMHTFRFVLPGAPDVVREVTVQQGARLQNVTVTFAPAPDATQVPSSSGAGTAISAVPEPAPPPPSPPRSSSGWKTVAYVVGGVGLAGLAAGGVLGAVALSASSREKSDCNSNLGACNNVGAARSDYDTAGSLADASTVAFVAGGVLAAAGVVIWLVAPSPSGGPTTTGGLEIAPYPGSLVVRGNF
jgi:hypothetical protein